MNRTSFFLIGLLLINASIHAQLNTIETEEQIVRRLVLSGATLPPDMTDSPYDNESFQLGEVFIKENKPYRAMLRYDAYRDNIEIKEEGKTYSLLKRDYIRVVFNNEKYAIFHYRTGKDEEKQGYFVQLTEGPLKLLKRKSKTFHYGTKGDGYTKAKPARFEDNVDYYIKQGDEIAEQVRLRKKTILNALSNYKEASKIVKERNLNLNKEREVVLLIKELNKAY
ncbi:MAG: hypothetical protein HKN52_06780 [Eudoraea sp.]|nr:hypothetical protein [Eudoraea sp.]